MKAEFAAEIVVALLEFGIVYWALTFLTPHPFAMLVIGTMVLRAIK